MNLKNNHLASDSLYLVNVAFFSLFTFFVLRVILIVRNFDLLDGIPGIDILYAFLIGMRFDLIVVSYTLLPLVFGLLLPKGLGKRKIATLWLTIAFYFYWCS